MEEALVARVLKDGEGFRFKFRDQICFVKKDEDKMYRYKRGVIPSKESEFHQLDDIKTAWKDFIASGRYLHKGEKVNGRVQLLDDTDLAVPAYSAVEDPNDPWTDEVWFAHQSLEVRQKVVDRQMEILYVEKIYNENFPIDDAWKEAVAKVRGGQSSLTAV